jgi:hypothetical protein
MRTGGVRLGLYFLHLLVNQRNGAQQVAAKGCEDRGAAIGNLILDQKVSDHPEEVVDGEGGGQVVEAALEVVQNIAVFRGIGGEMLVTRAEAGGGVSVQTATGALAGARPAAFKAGRGDAGSTRCGLG